MANPKKKATSKSASTSAKGKMKAKIKINSKRTSKSPVKANTKPAKKTTSKKTTIKRVTAKKLATTKAASKKSNSSRPTKVTTSKTKRAAIKSNPSRSIAKPVQAWLRPLDNRILIQILESELKTSGGIILTDENSKMANLEGTVLSVGRGHLNKKGKLRPVEVKTGDKVIFSKYAGDKISLNGINFVVIRETEILGFAA